jgi:hypothetical protein
VIVSGGNAENVGNGAIGIDAGMEKSERNGKSERSEKNGKSEEGGKSEQTMCALPRIV